MMLTLAATLAFIALHAWQDGLQPCNDGARYTSCKPQPPPFNRRFCYWPERLLQALSLICMLGLGAAMGSWTKAAMLLALPGAWFIVTHPTTTDAPCMLLAWGASIVFPHSPVMAILLSLVAGAMHERGPVFAAIYAWHPLLLLGLLGVQWWRKPAQRDGDAFVGHSFWDAIKAHKPYQDLLDPMVPLVGLRGALGWAVWSGCSTRAWVALLVAFGTRVIGTDSCRFLFWAALPLIADAKDVPIWVLGLHLATFRRAI